MTIIYTAKQDVKARVRNRRRKIAGSRHFRISAKAKRTIIIASICAMTVFGGYFGVRGEGFTTGAFAAEETIYKTVMVYNGDTIWGIASKYTEPSKDVRKQVRAICELNEVEPGQIHPGQTLLVPVPAHMA